MIIGDVLNGKYRIERLLGKGGTGSVYLCTNIEIGNKWAVKHIPPGKINDKTLSEIEILKRLYHLSLPRVVDVFRNKQGIYIVESNIEGSSLDRLLKRHGSFDIDIVTDWFLELCDILKYLHGIKPRPIIYRDMKPSNIMLAQGGRLVLVDFGISQEYCGYESEDTFFAGTSAYAAPEQLIKGGRTDQRTDIYNMGVTIYHLLYGRLPGSADYSLRHSKSKAASDIGRIISKCMESKPEDRYQRVEDIQKELEAVKNMLAVNKARQRAVFKLEIASIALLSAASYTAAVLGTVYLLPK
ncbi:MAG TPA: serine/threonine-protein kinase [Bacillota bacterium]|jgi:serine/threonine protein kinase|nr:serine/threonine-protein kinase [Bacillota bacterium]HQL35828.1 serine/threonine-protein kinase [Bacillota bacterium]